MERNSKTKLYYYFLGQNPFLPFLKNKKYLTNSNFEFYFWQMFFDVKGRFLQTFKKILIFKVPVFLKMKTLPRKRRTRLGKIRRLLLIELIKI